MPRSTREVIESHLQRRLDGNVDEDLRQNYSEDVLLLSAEGVHSGHTPYEQLPASSKAPFLRAAMSTTRSWSVAR